MGEVWPDPRPEPRIPPRGRGVSKIARPRLLKRSHASLSRREPAVAEEVRSGPRRLPGIGESERCPPAPQAAGRRLRGGEELRRSDQPVSLRPEDGFELLSRA